MVSGVGLHSRRLSQVMEFTLTLLAFTASPITNLTKEGVNLSRPLVLTIVPFKMNKLRNTVYRIHKEAVIEGAQGLMG